MELVIWIPHPESSCIVLVSQAEEEECWVIIYVVLKGSLAQTLQAVHLDYQSQVEIKVNINHIINRNNSAKCKNNKVEKMILQWYL